MSIASTFHEHSTISQVSLESIKVDRSYQRELSQGLVERIAENWDEVASELVLVSDRGEGRVTQWEERGRFYIVNGQHRLAAARKLGHETIWARVVDLSDLADPAATEADLRLKTNVRLGDRPLERFKAQLRSGEAESLEIVKILARYDTEINLAMTIEHGINAVSTVEAIYRTDEGALLAETMDVIKIAFGVVGGKSASAPLLKSVAWFIQQHSIEADRSRVMEKLGQAGYAALDRRARTMQSTMGGSLWMNYYRSIVDFYNERLTDKSRMEWRLRGASRFAPRKAITGETWGV